MFPRAAAGTEQRSGVILEHPDLTEMTCARHGKIVALAGNQKLLEIWLGPQIQQQIMRLNSLAPPARLTEVLAQHGSILDALEAGDVEAAVQAMKMHLAFSKSLYSNIVEKLNE